MLQVDGGGGAVVLAHGMHARRVAHRRGVGSHGVGGEGRQARVAQAHQLLDVEIGLGVDQRLGERRRLDQEEPVPVGCGKGHAGALVHRQRGRDVQQHGAADRVRMVHAQPVRDAGTAVVAAQRKALEAERGHQRHLVLRHGALAVVCVVGQPGGLVAVAIAAQVRGHYREMPRQLTGHLVPDHMRLRMAVQQQ
ncbi:hypothetical protein D3C72_1664370 [compost metagenome]